MQKSSLLILMFIVVGLSGCFIQDDKDKIIASMLSDTEGKYYITMLNVSEREFEEKVFQSNVSILAGYYANENPSTKEIKVLEIDEKIPLYIVFDSEKELFRTSAINELNKFLKEKTIKNN